MGVIKTILDAGNMRDKPTPGDEITVSYVGHLYDMATNSWGAEFDSSAERGDFTIQIGVGKVIAGWDHGILDVGGGMYLGERALIAITSDWAYGAEGFPDLIPANTDLIFDLQLKAINGMKA